MIGHYARFARTLFERYGSRVKFRQTLKRADARADRRARRHADRASDARVRRRALPL
jgi:hypothetical protein